MSSAPATRLACPGCDGCAGTLLFEKAGYRYRRCSDCGLVFSDPPIADPAELYDGLFEEAWLERERTRTMAARKQAIYRRQLGNLLRCNPAARTAASVFDVGCGVGGFLRAAQELGLAAEGLEISAVAAECARREFGLAVRVGSCEELETPERRFGIIRANALLEHLRDPGAGLKRLRPWLVEGGVLFGMTLNAESWTFRRAGAAWRMVGMGGHVTLFSPRNLERILRNAGFSSLKTWTSGFREERCRLPKGVERVIGKAAALAGRGHRLYFEATI